MKEVLKGIIENAIRENPIVLSEVYQENGKCYCKVCKTPRQTSIFVFGETITVPRLCDCQVIKRDEEEEEKKAAKLLEIIAARREWCFPSIRFHSYTFANDDGQMPEETEECFGYVENFKKFKERGLGMLLWGGVGTGKTYLAACVANALLDIGYRVKFTSFISVIEMAQDFGNANTHFYRLMDCDCIIVDDLGTERNSNFASEQVQKFINGCNERNIPLIITTNHTPKRLQEIANDRTEIEHARMYSRILEKSTTLKIDGTKRRDEIGVKNREIAKMIMAGKI